MSWNEFQKAYKAKHGPAPKTEVAAAYYKTKGTTRGTTLNLNKVLKSVPKSRKEKIRSLKKVIKNKSSPRGKKTRGFKAASPQKGHERAELLAKCGSKAFLIPSEKKFPVMAAVRAQGKNATCNYSCEGLNAAKNRACQYGYTKEANKAQAIGTKYCGWSPKKRACNK
jgi:hypothetical protein